MIYENKTKKNQNSSQIQSSETIKGQKRDPNNHNKNTEIHSTNKIKIFKYIVISIIIVLIIIAIVVILVFCLIKKKIKISLYNNSQKKRRNKK